MSGSPDVAPARRVPATIDLEDAVLRRWDAVVVGAGPAGAAVAARLAVRGLAVLLCDTSEMPRPKLCGCCLSTTALAELAKLDALVGKVASLDGMPAGGLPLERVRLATAAVTAVLPLPRGGGIEFVDAVKGGVIPGQFMPAVEKGVREACATGVLAGFPLVDVKVTVFDGKHHSVDSKEIAFVTAARKALQLAVREARAVVLEPIVSFDVLTPEHAVGDVSGDLASNRGQVTGTRTAVPGQLLVQGQAPLAELATFQTRLNAMTSGQARYTLAFSHYEPVPPNTQAALAAAHQVHDDD